MKKSRRNIRKPGFERALLFIRKLIADARYCQGTKLPAAAELARGAGVSTKTLLKALRCLVTENILCKSGGRVFMVYAGYVPDGAVEAPDTASLPLPRMSAAEAIADAVRREILLGTLGQKHGTLSYKELQIYYASSFRTVRKALALLCREGLIARHKRSFAVIKPGRLAGAARHRAIVMFDYEYPGGINPLYFPQDSEFCRAFETECAHKGIRGRLVTIINTSGEIFLQQSPRKRLHQFADDDSVMGYVYVVKRTDTPDETALRTLLRFGKPVAVLDRTGSAIQLAPVVKSSLVRMFIASISRKGPCEVARFLLDRGHRRIAYISTYHGAAWSQQRFAAIKETFAAAGIAGGVTLCATPSLSGSSVAYAASMARCSSRAVQQHFRQWLAAAPPEFDWWKSMPSDMEPVYAALYHQHIATEHRLACRPLFEQARTDSAISAWVLANDQLAEMALDFCIQRNISVPRRLWLIGFDDAPVALARRLTSYNFSPHGTARAMLNFILRPSAFAEIHKQSVVEIDGAIAERNTTAAHWQRPAV